MQKVEASLIIIEAKLSSIPSLDESKPKTEVNSNSSAVHIQEIQKEETKEIDASTVARQEETDEQLVPSPVETGVKACEDTRYKKFFKMVQFGVPINAVKMKMKAEGADPAIIDTPNLLLPDGTSS